MLVDKL